MTAARRVRVAKTTLNSVGRDPRPKPIMLIEYPHIVSSCDGRPDIWEWRLWAATLAATTVGRFIQ